MAHRLGIFIAVIIVGLGVLIAHPWTTDLSFTSSGQRTLIIMTVIFAAIVYAIIRGIGWVASGK